MQIKTITCHHVYNPGASLQAYALQQYLIENGHEVEIIDYLPDYLTEEYKFFSVTNERFSQNWILRAIYILLKLPNKILFLRRKRFYEKFKQERLKITKKVYTNNHELKSNCPKADLYIAGSDQIWNTEFQNGRDPAFYLAFAPENSIKASYAASFGGDNIKEDIIHFIKKMVLNLDYISVREKSGKNILCNMGIDAECVCDPVFLLDKNIWINIIQRKKKNEKYIFLYDFDQNELLKEVAIYYAQKHNFKIYSMFKSDISDRNFFCSGPEEFLSLIYHAELILTNSFHAVAFSVIFQKEFWVAKRKENLNSRLIDMLIELGLEKRMISSIENINEESILYNYANKKVDEKKKLSVKYLKLIMGEQNGNIQDY